MSTLLTRREASARTRLCPRTLDRHVAAGTGPRGVVRLSKRVLFKAEELDAWIDDNTVPASPAPPGDETAAAR